MSEMHKQMELGEKYILKTYNRFPVLFERGEGVYLYDAEGKAYLDFAAGIAVQALGYNNKAYNDALKDQLDKIIKLYNKPRLEMCKNSYEISKSKFDLLYKICLPAAIVVCVALSVIYSFLVRNGRTSFAEPFHGNVSMMLFMFAVLLFFVLALEGLELLLVYFVSQQHNAKVAARELEHETCGSDITLFILGDIKHSRFREGEDSKLHHRRQRRRLVLWIALGILLVTALGVSIRCNQFPLFLIIGAIALILFMYADCVPSNNEFYTRACGEFDNDATGKQKVRDARACFFEQEYDETHGTFDLASDYYKEDEINLYALKDELKKTGKAKRSFSHEVKQRIYSMAIDRVKNDQVMDRSYRPELYSVAAGSDVFL